VARQDERIWLFSSTGITCKRFDTSVWREPVIPTWSRKLHKNEKPLALMKRLVMLLADAGQIIADPFMGSRTTLVAAKALGVRAIGIDLNEKYCEIAAKRLAQETLFGAVP
jgi:site-specific DNA-methyltransferase (adenine-specific)